MSFQSSFSSINKKIEIPSFPFIELNNFVYICKSDNFSDIITISIKSGKYFLVFEDENHLWKHESFHSLLDKQIFNLYNISFKNNTSNNLLCYLKKPLIIDGFKNTHITFKKVSFIKNIILFDIFLNNEILGKAINSTYQCKNINNNIIYNGFGLMIKNEINNIKYDLPIITSFSYINKFIKNILYINIFNKVQIEKNLLKESKYKKIFEKPGNLFKLLNCYLDYKELNEIENINDNINLDLLDFELIKKNKNITYDFVIEKKYITDSGIILESAKDEIKEIIKILITDTLEELNYKYNINEFINKFLKTNYKYLKNAYSLINFTNIFKSDLIFDIENRNKYVSLNNYNSKNLICIDKFSFNNYKIEKYYKLYNPKSYAVGPHMVEDIRVYIYNISTFLNEEEFIEMTNFIFNNISSIYIYKTLFCVNTNITLEFLNNDKKVLTKKNKIIINENNILNKTKLIDLHLKFISTLCNNGYKLFHVFMENTFIYILGNNLLNIDIITLNKNNNEYFSYPINKFPYIFKIILYKDKITEFDKININIACEELLKSMNKKYL